MYMDIDGQRILDSLNTSKIGKTIIILDQVDSTNTYLKGISRQSAKEGTLVIALKQSSGRGRRGKNWESKKGSSINMSFMVKPAKRQIPSLYYVPTAIALAQTISEITGQRCSIKWPNDIIINSRKLAGILIESEYIGSTMSFMVIGVGLNLLSQAYSKELKFKAISLDEICQEPINPEMLIAKFLNRFERLEKLLTKEGLSLIKDSYKALSHTIGSLVTLEGNKDLRGKAIDIDDMGRLLVKDQENNIHTVRSSDISIKGVSGYVDK